MYDVIVIGAGPAGAAAAKISAENGCKVLLTGKFKMPCDKSCSGQLIKRSVDLVESYFGEAVPASAMCAPAENRGMVFTSDRGRAFRFEQNGLNIWHSSFDSWLAAKAGQWAQRSRPFPVKNGVAEGCYARLISYMEGKHGLRIDRQLKVDKWLMPHIRPGCTAI